MAVEDHSGFGIMDKLHHLFAATDSRGQLDWLVPCGCTAMVPSVHRALSWEAPLFETL